MSHNANPAQYGWTYQGSNQASKVEFYEKDGVKMDYYYTTGEIDVMCISAGALRNRITAQHAQHGGQGPMSLAPPTGTQMHCMPPTGSCSAIAAMMICGNLNYGIIIVTVGCKQAHLLQYLLC